MRRVDDEFEEWVLATRRRARSVAVRIVPAAVDPEDITAEAYARALVRWPSVRAMPHRDAWLLRVVSNLAIDAVRSSSRRERALALERAVEAVPAGDDATADRLVLGLALSRLSRRQQEVIVLRHLVGLPEAEVAAALGVSVNTVKTHLARGLSTLRDRLGPTCEEPNLAG